ncbi:MAG: LapA family protein [Chitinispirillales bacterium]|jgi:uncharacterized integral membrane protein|nr:LapA family protein [Chitinispirillales bacterium]
MKVVKWSLVIAVTAAITCILIFTFIQEPFKASAQVKIPWCNLPEIPIYLYLAATFAIGLLLGFFAAAYYYIAGQAGIHSKKKEIRRLEEVVAELTFEMEGLRKSAGQASKKITESLKAVGEKDLLA